LTVPYLVDPNAGDRGMLESAIPSNLRWSFFVVFVVDVAMHSMCRSTLQA